MSGEVVGWAFKQALTPTQKLVLVALADNAQDDGKAWPGKHTIVTKTGLGKSSVYRSLEELEGADLLRHGKDDRGIECYWLAVPQREDDSQGGKADSQGGKPYREPSSEPSGNQTPSSPASSSGSDDVEIVWSVYVQVFEKKGHAAELLPDSRKIIRDALKAGTAEELVTCIRANYASDYHQKRGEHKHRKGGKYNSIGQILKPRARNGETQRSRIEWWLEKAGEGGDKETFDPNAYADQVRKEQGLD